MYGHLYELLLERVARYPGAIAVGGQERLTWKSLDSREMLALVDRLAGELIAEGVREGDRVVLWVPNGWRTPVYYYAIWRLGAIVVPFDREMNPEGGARILAAVEPRLVIAGYGERPPWARQAAVLEWWEPGTRRPEASPPPWARPAEMLAAIMFTSGTTGQPKGCMLTQEGLCSQVEGIRARIALDPDCRLASVLPLSHNLELAGMNYALDCGAATHYVPSRRGPDVARVLIEQRITHMIVVPQFLTIMGRSIESQLAASPLGRLYSALGRHVEGLPLPARRRLYWPVHRKLGGHLRMMLSGGAALAPETQRFWEHLGVRVLQGYGTSETSPVVAMACPDGSTPIGSVGPPIQGVSVRLSPEGELQVHGPNVMRGYWKDPVRTAEVLHDGWYSTGDLASIDPAGNVRLVGRVRDLIALPSGMNVWPEDVEQVLREHAAVKDAAVVAVPTPSGGATLHAYLLPASPADRSVDLASVISACNGRLAQHQRLATASWYPEADFPRTAMLKLRRHLLPNPDAIETVQVESVLAGDDPVAAAVAGVARVASVQQGQTLGQLGLDSLGLVELALALEEKTGKAVGDGDLRIDLTVEQVRQLLLSAPRLDEAQLRQRAQAARASRAEQPLWPYTWGRALRVLDFPIDLLYRVAITRTIVLGAEFLADLPRNIVISGTHRSFADTPLVRHALARHGARYHARRLVPAIAAGARFRGFWAEYGIVAVGLHPIMQQADRDAYLRSLVRVARAGNVILIFPQGTHARREQELAGDPAVSFKPGFAHLAAALDAPVLPFGLAGPERVIPPYLEGFTGLHLAGIPVLITRGPLAIAFGPPTRLEPGETPQAFSARLQAICDHLTRQAEVALEVEAGGPFPAGDPMAAS